MVDNYYTPGTNTIAFHNFVEDNLDKEDNFVPSKEKLVGKTEEEQALLLAFQDVARHVFDKWQRAKDARQATEKIWMQSWDQFRGEYSPEEKSNLALVKARDPQASSFFAKITKTKTMAAVGQILDILEADKRFPITIESTPKPLGVPDEVHIGKDDGKVADIGDVYGYVGDGSDLPKGATHNTLLDTALTKFKKLIGNGLTVKEGKALDPSQGVTLNPAKMAAAQMDKLVQDQLIESVAQDALRRAALECGVLGTGVIKGPFNYLKEYPKWSRDEESGEMMYAPIVKVLPKVSYVSCWNSYPDPDATKIEDAEYMVERHLLSRSELRSLRTQPGFYADAINRIIDGGQTSVTEHWEPMIHDNTVGLNQDRFQILEYWGFLDKDLAQSIGIDVEHSDIDVVQVNIWATQDEVIRAVINPFQPMRIPYYFIPYEEHPYQIWGIGVPENMKDAQDLMNSSIRMSIDNMRLAGNLVFEVNDQYLVPGQDDTIYTGKVFHTQGPPGQAIRGIDFPNTSQSNMMLYDKARQLADEKSGVPSFAHGQTGVSGIGRAASGISMLMGAAALSTKTVIKNWDHHLLKPLGDALFAWNMQFNEDCPEIRGDLSIKASGTQSLMQKEVVSQRILSLIQTASNPQIAPFLNFEAAFKELAKALDLDPETFINGTEQAALYAQIMGAANGNSQQQGQGTPPAPQASGAEGMGGAFQGSPAGAGTPDTSGNGGGNIGFGSPA